MINKLFLQEKQSFPKPRNYINNTVTVISTLKGIKEEYSFIFKDPYITNQFIDIIKQKTNYRRYEADYIIKQKLGSGISGTVMYAQNKITNQPSALKIIPLNYKSRSQMQILFNELDICKLLLKASPDDKLLQYYDYYETENYICIVMEYIKGITLDNFIANQPNKFEGNKMKIVGQLINILKIMSDFSIIHRDIKPSNVMIGVYQKELVVKVIDYGFSQVIGRLDNIKESLGTIAFAAPEVLLNQSYSFKIDLWGLGIIIYRMLFGKLPFNPEEKEKEKMIHNIINEPLKLPSESMHSKNSLLILIIAMSLKKNSNERSSINDLNDLWNSHYNNIGLM